MAGTAEQDGAKLEAAAEAMMASKFAVASGLLQAVIANTPSDYRHVREGEGGEKTIEFWNQEAFLHYVAWMQAHPPVYGVTWMPNVYPHAHYLMGFLCVKLKRYVEASNYLRRGVELEPTNPLMRCELGQALVGSGDAKGALEMYESIGEIGLFVSPQQLAMAYRGRGFVLVEMAKLEEAEAAFEASLKLEPGSKVALSELKYIDHLRKGGKQAPSIAVESGPGKGWLTCVSCGKKVMSGQVANVVGKAEAMCDRCIELGPKKWWQFWR